VEERICAASWQRSVSHAFCHPSCFWLIEKLPCVLIHHTRQTWHPVISGYAIKLDWRWKETVLTRFQRSKLQRKSVNERWFLELLQKLTEPLEQVYR
jgi:hypothetical protein